MDRRPVAGDVEPLKKGLSFASCACRGDSNWFATERRFLGGFVMRRELLTERLVSLGKVRRYGLWLRVNALDNVGNMRIFAFSLAFDAYASLAEGITI